MEIVALACRRVVLAAVTLLIVSALVFSAIEALPGDVASRVLGRDATPESLSVLRAQMHLTDPAPLRYMRWLGAALKGDLGQALTNSRPIASIIAAPLGHTLLLSLMAFAIYLPLVLLPAMIQAVRYDEAIDHALSIVTLVLASVPDFLLATLLLLAFGVALPILPVLSIVDQTTTVAQYLRALALPATTLAIVMAVYAERMLRDNLIDVMKSDYVRMAELKGLSQARVLLRHALPNALIPAINVTAINLGYLFGGVVIVEKVFDYPGFGTLLIDALELRDAPLIEATVLIAATVYILANLFADIAAILLNPKLRRG